MRAPKRERGVEGFTMIEVVVALTIVALAVVGIVGSQASTNATAVGVEERDRLRRRSAELVDELASIELSAPRLTVEAGREERLEEVCWSDEASGWTSCDSVGPEPTRLRARVRVRQFGAEALGEDDSDLASSALLPGGSSPESVVWKEIVVDTRIMSPGPFRRGRRFLSLRKVRAF